MSGDPYSKERQLARGARRYRRKVASPKQWQAIIAAKAGPCRVCAQADPRSNGYDGGIVEFHHLVPRDQGGDDLADNIVPLHRDCHAKVTGGDKDAVQQLGRSLTPEETRYILNKLGKGLGS